jgi:hypothetical protein
LKENLHWSGMAELANATVIHPGDVGSNLNINRKYFIILYGLDLKFKSVEH